MCGRYTLKTRLEDLQAEFGLAGGVAVAERYNIAPTQAAPLILNTAPTLLATGRWGLLPPWAKDAKQQAKLINARSETLAEKPSFRQALHAQRCVVPCDGFYEWKRHGKQKTPMYITSTTGRPLGMAGLWNDWTSPDGVTVTTFSVITTQANELVRPIHDRMPVFLDAEARHRWLTGPTKDTASLLELLKPWHGAPLTAWEVSPHVNSVAVDDARCIAPATTSQLSLL